MDSWRTAGGQMGDRWRIEGLTEGGGQRDDVKLIQDGPME